MSRQRQLAKRRAELVARSARLRGELAVHGALLGSRLGLVDRGIALIRAATERPLLLAAGAALLLVFKPMRALKWAARGAVLTSLVRSGLTMLDYGKPPPEPPTFI